MEKVIRFIKTTLILCLALFFIIVVINNLTDYNTNFMFVEHVLSMDTTFDGNSLMYRAINNILVHHIFYWIIIVFEILAGLFLLIGGIKMFKSIDFSSKKFIENKKYAFIGLLISIVLWFLFFIIVGGEWFSMWQSNMWNGQDAAFRMFTITGIIFLILMGKN